MATLEEKIAAEHQMRELLRESGMPQPDRVEYGYTCIRLFFLEPGTVVVVDIDESDELEGDPPATEDLNGTSAREEQS